MGIYDRDYYRREGPSYLETLIPSGTVCKWLIGINIVVFIVQVIGYVPGQWTPNGQLPDTTGWFTDTFILDTSAVLNGQVWRLLTYAFLHSPEGWSHIFFNMLFLWWFGSDLEALYRPKEFLAFYLASATFGGIAYVGWQVSNGDTAPCLGASGAVTALLILYAFHFPYRVIYVFMFLPVPIWLFAIFNIVQDTFGLLGGSHENVAFVVHLAGALFAFLYYKFQLRLIDLFDVSHWFGWLKKKRTLTRPRLKLYRPEDEAKEPVGVSAPTASNVDEHFEAKLDAVLEKLARTGKESLTEGEREILLQASEIYKRRRT